MKSKMIRARDIAPGRMTWPVAVASLALRAATAVGCVQRDGATRHRLRFSHGGHTVLASCVVLGQGDKVNVTFAVDKDEVNKDRNHHRAKHRRQNADSDA